MMNKSIKILIRILALGCVFVLKTSAYAKDLFDITDYGAYSGGTVDCTSAVKNAVNDAVESGGGTVYFPAGSYLIKDTIAVSSNIQISGNNSNIIFTPELSDGKALFYARNAQNVKIERLKVTGNEYAKALFLAESVTDTYISENIVSKMPLVSAENGCKNFIVEKNTFSSDSEVSSGIDFRSCSGVIIRNNNISGYTQSIDLADCDVTINGNNICGGGIKLVRINSGIVRENNINSEINFSLYLSYCKNCVISSNNIVLKSQSGIILYEKNQNISIISNIIRSTEPRMTLLKIGGGEYLNRLINISQNKFLHEPGSNGFEEGSGFSNVDAADSDNLIFNNNYIDNIAVAAGKNCSSVQIEGNFFLLENLAGDEFCALSVYKCGDCNISGNSFLNNGAQESIITGVQIEENTGSVTFISNTLSGFDTELKTVCGSRHGIAVRNNCFAGPYINCSQTNSVLVTFSGNRDRFGKELNLEQITANAQERDKYADYTSDEYLGKVYSDGEWRNFGKIGCKVRIFSLSRDGNTINAIFSGKDIESGNVLIVAVYDADGKLIKVNMKRESRDYMYENFNDGMITPGAPGSMFQIRWANTPWVYDDSSVNNVNLVSSDILDRNNKTDMCIKLSNANIYGDRFYFYPYRNNNDALMKKRLLVSTDKTGNQSELVSVKFAVEPSGADGSTGNILIRLNYYISLCIRSGKILSADIGDTSISINKEFDVFKWHKLGINCIFSEETGATAQILLDGEQITETVGFDSSGTGSPEVGNEVFNNNTIWGIHVFNTTGVRNNNSILSGTADILYIDDVSIKIDALEGTISNTVQADPQSNIKAFLWNNIEDMRPINNKREIKASE